MRQVDVSKQHSGQMAHHGGAAAEESVERKYVDMGCQTVARRWRGTSGEIDLIMREDDVLIFVEVKKSASFARAASRITPAQTRRIFATAEEFSALEPMGLLSEMRFDVALVDAVGEIQLLENALSSDGFVV